MPSSLLVLGGARSGKSRFAIASQPARARIAFVATAQAGDADMTARIARHKAERPSRWQTLEEPFDLAARLGRLSAIDGAVVDCLTLWVSNRLLRGDADEAILEESAALAALIKRRPYELTLVSNEVGEGVHPSTGAGLRFRDLLGLVNQQIAAACDRVVLMVAGVPLTVRAPALPAPGGGVGESRSATGSPGRSERRGLGGHVGAPMSLDEDGRTDA